KIGLPFHHGEIQVAAFSVQWRAEPKRSEKIPRERRFRVAVPMHPRSLVDVPNQSEFDRRVRLRSVEKRCGKEAKGVVTSGSGCRRNFVRRLIRNVQGRPHVVKKLEHRVRKLRQSHRIFSELQFTRGNLKKLTRCNFFRSEWIRGHSFGNAGLLRLPRAVECAVSRFRVRSEERRV